jgi:formate dehydrogenase iron-sulfur subunit
VVQNEICNGCGYCVPACPYGVIERRTGPVGNDAVGVAQKCTLCYDRLKGGMEPACAKACPTQSIQFGDLDELRVRAGERLGTLTAAGIDTAQLYGHDPGDGVGGAGALFLLFADPETYGLPPDPVVTTKDLPQMWRTAGAAALTMLAGTVAAFAATRGR